MDAWVSQAAGELLVLARTWGVAVATMLAICAVGAAVERLRPVRARADWASVGFNVRWIVVGTALSTLALACGFSAIAPLVREWTGGPWIALTRPQGALGYAANWLVYFLVFDFFYYFFHRLQHASPWLWPFHELHHSETALGVTTTQRHHWMEEPLRALAIAVPMGVVVAVDRGGAPLLAVALGSWSYFVHANLRLELGPLTPVVAGPHFHRIHHSVEARHRERNFAAFFPFWDVLFGTYCAPRRGEFPEVGLEGRPAITHVRDALWPDFRSRPPRARA